jgi:hypothetical protein
MTRVPVPPELAQSIADLAARKAREGLRGKGWKSSGALQPYSEPGRVGISSTVNHLLIQNRGFKPFVMWWVRNRTVPLACKQGDGPHIRFGNPESVGTPGVVDIPHRGKVFRPQRWRHPGLKPKRFMETAITRAVKDSRMDIREAVMNSLKGGR